MKSAPLPADESCRLEALRSYDILDTSPQEFYDRLMRIAAEACQVPIALVSLVDAGRQRFKSSVGIDVVSDLPANRDVVAVVHATVCLIDNLGMTSLAEGVETATPAQASSRSNAALASSRVS